jgi:hypothetical protein
VALQNTLIEGKSEFRDSGIQGFRDLGIQGFRDYLIPQSLNLGI